MINSLTEIQKKLRAVIEREKRRDGLKKLYVFIIDFCLASLIIITLELLGNYSSGFRTILFFSLITVSVLFFAVYVAYPFIKDFIYYKNPDYVDTSRKVGNFFPEVKDDLANAVQILNEKNGNYSDQLINAAFENAYNKTGKLDFSRVVDFSATKKIFRISAFTFAAMFIIVSFIPGFNGAAYRLINFNKNFTPPPKFVFLVQPGNVEIAKGENVSIHIRTTGMQPASIVLSTKSEEQSEFSEKKLLPDSLGEFVFNISSVKNSFDYSAYAENISSSVYKITVINRPNITGFDVTIFPPAYTHLPEQTQKDNGNISALPGSRLRLALNSSRELSKASIKLSDSTSKAMNINSSRSSAEFNVTKDVDYQFHIEDSQGIENVNPITYSIKVLPDAAPEIQLISPSGNVRLAQETKLSTVSKISDDFGFSKMNLCYRLSTSKYRQTSNEFTKIPIPISTQLKEDEIYFVWDLAPLVLAEGEAISCYLEVFDNDVINGPKSAKTQQFTISVPSLDDLYSDASNKQDETTKDLTKTLKDAEDLKQEMQKITDDLKQNSKDISWQEKERAEKAAEKFNEIGKKIDEISKKLSEMKNDLAKNNLLSEETLKKYNELQELLEKMSTDEMKDAFKRMQDALKGMNRDNVQMSMEEMKANEEYIKKSIERTLNLLKRIQVEQKVDELLKRAQELADKIESLKNKTDQSNLADKPKRDELSAHQNDITKDLKDLNNEMNKLDDKMSGMKDLPKDQLEQIQKEFEKQNNQKLSDEAANDISQMQKSEAMQNQQQLSQNMKSMGKQMKGLQSAMQQMNQMKSFYDMMNILDDILTLSKDQEKLKNETEQMGSNSQDLTKSSREQNEIQNNLGKVLQKMGELSQKTFAITPEMGKALGKASSDMQQSINAIQNRQGPAAAQIQKNAMASLNEAAGMMKGAMNQMMNGNGQGGGMMSLMQQLQQLGQQQMNLNQLTQMMNQGQLPQEMAAQMQRLAQQQETIRKSLAQFNQEAKESGQSKRLAANLDKILNEMKEVVTNLQSEKVNNDVVKQQEKILSKLLDAQRSMNERDYEEERKSEAGKNYSLTSPPDLLLNTEEGRNKLRDALTKAIKEGYKKDYEDLIRKYFEALEKIKK